jgi:hypothetical protein
MYEQVHSKVQEKIKSHKATESSRISVLSSIAHLKLGFVRFMKMEYQEVVLRLANFQRYMLEIIACIDLQEHTDRWIHNPHAPERDVNKKFMGVFTDDDVVAGKYYAMGVPVWYGRHLSTIPHSMIIHVMVTPQKTIFAGDWDPKAPIVISEVDCEELTTACQELQTVGSMSLGLRPPGPSAVAAEPRSPSTGPIRSVVANSPTRPCKLAHVSTNPVQQN